MVLSFMNSMEFLLCFVDDFFKLPFAWSNHGRVARIIQPVGVFTSDSATATARAAVDGNGESSCSNCETVTSGPNAGFFTLENVFFTGNLGLACHMKTAGSYGSLYMYCICIYICVCVNQIRICNIYSLTNKAVWNEGKHNRETMWMFRRIHTQ